MNEPKPPAEMPECPDYLSDEAKAVWPRFAQDLYDTGVLTRVDGAALELLCATYARWMQAEQGLREHGLLVKAPSGFLMQSPLLAVANRSLQQLQKLLTEFGMTPSSRSRIVATPRAKDEDAHFFDA